jgi:hypothetical protein
MMRLKIGKIIWNIRLWVNVLNVNLKEWCKKHLASHIHQDDEGF